MAASKDPSVVGEARAAGATIAGRGTIAGGGTIAGKLGGGGFAAVELGVPEADHLAGLFIALGRQVDKTRSGAPGEAVAEVPSGCRIVPADHRSGRESAVED